jgi:hypothetical protein
MSSGFDRQAASRTGSHVARQLARVRSSVLPYRKAFLHDPSSTPKRGEGMRRMSPRSLSCVVCCLACGCLALGAGRSFSQVKIPDININRVLAEVIVIVVQEHIMPSVRDYARQAIPDLMARAKQFAEARKSDGRSWYDFWSDKEEKLARGGKLSFWLQIHAWCPQSIFRLLFRSTGKEMRL